MTLMRIPDFAADPNAGMEKHLLNVKRAAEAQEARRVSRKYVDPYSLRHCSHLGTVTNTHVRSYIDSYEGTVYPSLMPYSQCFYISV